MRIRYGAFLGLIVLTLAGVTASLAEVDVNVQVNFNELNDYGEWVVVPGYGTVWRPDADPDWRPFVYGHWAYSSDGWIWDSDEPFGWIVCHYGNWYYDDDQGWVWLPGYKWSAARVRWYVTDNEIGWAPLFPEPRHGYHQNAIHLQWTFAPVSLFTSVDVRSHLAIRRDAAPSGVRAQVYAGPPRREFIQQRLGTPIRSTSIKKLRMTSREKHLIKIEVQNQKRPAIEIPVGPKYKRVNPRWQSVPDKTKPGGWRSAPLWGKKKSGSIPAMTRTIRATTRRITTPERKRQKCTLNRYHVSVGLSKEEVGE